MLARKLAVLPILLDTQNRRTIDDNERDITLSARIIFSRSRFGSRFAAGRYFGVRCSGRRRSGSQKSFLRLPFRWGISSTVLIDRSEVGNDHPHLQRGRRERERERAAVGVGAPANNGDASDRRSSHSPRKG